MRPVWIDCDAGTDDAQAVMMALVDPSVRIVGISCVNGNVDVDKVAVNVAHILRVAARASGPAGSAAARLHSEGVDAIPVYRGATAPLVRKPVDAEFWHGIDGLGDVDWAARGEADDHAELPSTVRDKGDPCKHAALALCTAARANAGVLEVVAIGPLTNLALAVRLDPSLPSLIKRIVVMGGAMDAFGNATASAEFNFFGDPEAANIVLTEFASVELVGWKATFEHGLDVEWVQSAWLGGAGGSALQSFVNAISIVGVGKCAARRQPYLIPDPLAMAVALRPDAATSAFSCEARVELAPGSLTYGQLVLDRRYVFLGGAATSIVEDQADIEEVLDGRAAKAPAAKRAHTLRVVSGIDMDIVRELLLKSVGAAASS